MVAEKLVEDLEQTFLTALRAFLQPTRTMARLVAHEGVNKLSVVLGLTRS